MITQEDYFGRISFAQWGSPSPEVYANSVILLERVNHLLEMVLKLVPDMEAAKHPQVNSGWRPAAYNATVPNAATRSKHTTGEAIDLADPDGELDNLLLDNIGLLQGAGLWMEHPLATKNYCHLQCVPPRSSNRVFYP